MADFDDNTCRALADCTDATPPTVSNDQNTDLHSTAAQQNSSNTSAPSHNDGNESEAEPDDQRTRSSPRLRSEPSHADGNETESEPENEPLTSSSETSAPPHSDGNQSDVQHADGRADSIIDSLTIVVLLLCGHGMMEAVHHKRELFLNVSLKTNCPVIELHTSVLLYAARCAAAQVVHRYAEVPPDEILRALLHAIHANGHQSSIISTAPGLAYTSLVPVARADPLDQENNASRVVPPSASHLDHEQDPAILPTSIARCAPSDAASFAVETSVASRTSDGEPATAHQTHDARGLPAEAAMGQAALLPEVAARIFRINREDSPLKNETVCFIDESTFRYFSRLLRPNVLMVATPMPSFVDALRSVLQFHLTDNVGRVIFWFSDCHVTLAGQMRLAVELSRHYATHYQDIMQYVVATPSISSRHDIWTCALFKLLAQMRVTLPNAQLVMCPRESSITVQAAANGLKHHLRDHHQLDLWSRYDAVTPLVADTSPATAQPDATLPHKQPVDATLPVSSGTPKKASHRQRGSKRPQKPPTQPQASRHSKPWTGPEVPNKTNTNCKRPEPSHNDGKGAAAQPTNCKRPEPSHSDGEGAAARKSRKERKERPSSGDHHHHRSRLTPADSAEAPMPPKAKASHNYQRPPAHRKNVAHLPIAPLEDAASHAFVRRSPVCAFCTGPHWTTKCSHYRTVDQRLRRMLVLGSCATCLRTGHTFDACPSNTTKAPCKFCKQGQHHRALCPVASSIADDGQPLPTHRKKGKHLPIVTPSSAAAGQIIIRRSRGCAFCEHPHCVAKCARYRTCAQRFRRSRALGLCLICLRAGHRAHACPCRTTTACQYCRQGQHHLALCPAVTPTTRAKQTPLPARPRDPDMSLRTPAARMTKLCDAGRSVQSTDAPTTAQMSPPGKPIEAEHRRQPRKRKDRVPRK